MLEVITITMLKLWKLNIVERMKMTIAQQNPHLQNTIQVVQEMLLDIKALSKIDMDITILGLLSKCLIKPWDYNYYLISAQKRGYNHWTLRSRDMASIYKIAVLLKMEET